MTRIDSALIECAFIAKCTLDRGLYGRVVDASAAIVPLRSWSGDFTMNSVSATITDDSGVVT